MQVQVPGMTRFVVALEGLSEAEMAYWVAVDAAYQGDTGVEALPIDHPLRVALGADKALEDVLAGLDLTIEAERVLLVSDECGDAEYAILLIQAFLAMFPARAPICFQVVYERGGVDAQTYVGEGYRVTLDDFRAIITRQVADHVAVAESLITMTKLVYAAERDGASPALRAALDHFFAITDISS